MGCHPSRTSIAGYLEDGSPQSNHNPPDGRIQGRSLPHDLPTAHQPVQTTTDNAVEDDAKPHSINNQDVEDEEPLIHLLPIEILSEIESDRHFLTFPTSQNGLQVSFR